MARGNQRELARQKNLKKQQEAAKGKKNSGNMQQRMISDAEAMRQKQAAADAKKAEESKNPNAQKGQRVSY